jgi:hypothetical protein
MPCCTTCACESKLHVQYINRKVIAFLDVYQAGAAEHILFGGGGGAKFKKKVTVVFD